MRRQVGGLAQDMLVELDRTVSAPPLHHQIETSIRDAVRTGRLVHGTVLPASRTLAAELGVSRGVIVEAYQQLVAEGFLVSTPGGYTRVAAPTVELSTRPKGRSGTTTRIDFGYGRCDPASFPRSVWLRSLRRVLNEVPHERLAYPSGHGVPEVRLALANYLNRARGLSAYADHVVMCSGFGQAANLILAVLAGRGARRIAVEDPSVDDDIRPVAASLGLEIVGIPVDERGWDLSALDRSGAQVVSLTPSHQWPIGALLSTNARMRIIQWARTNDAVIIEDDYDAEYRYDQPAIGALQGRAPNHVAYVGTASKTLAAGLRLGWMVLPPELVDPVAEAKLLADRGSPVMDQLAFADFLGRGELDRHLRRMRPIYRRRRDVLITAVRSNLPMLTPIGIAAGLHLVTWLPDTLDEEAVEHAAEQAGVRVSGLRRYRLWSGGTSRGGLIFGYSALSERLIVEGVERLAKAIAAM